MVLPDHPAALSVFKGMNQRKLEAKLAENPLDFITLLKDCSLIPSERHCKACGSICNLVKDRSALGYQFECSIRKCRKRIAATDSSFFSRSRLRVDEILRFTYYFARGEYKYEKLEHELRRNDGSTLSPNTISDWISFLREVCACAIDEDPQQIGGEGKIVEIDETCMVKHKFHRGVRMAKPTWVFGGKERGETSKMFCIVVERRDKATLEPLIQKYIAPKTTIISDGWAAYSGIKDLVGDYTHQVVNHSKFFKDPDTGAHTNSIEGEWMHLKAPQKAANGRPRNTLEPSLFEHMFRRRFKEDDIFYALLVYITKIYDVKEKSKEDVNACPAFTQAVQEEEDRENRLPEQQDGTSNVDPSPKRASPSPILLVDGTEDADPSPKRAREEPPELFDASRELFFDSD